MGSYFNAISFATRDAIGTALSPVAPISVDFLLCEEVEQFDEEDAARYGKGECKEASDYDTDCREVQERLAVMVAPTDNPKRWSLHSWCCSMLHRTGGMYWFRSL